MTTWVQYCAWPLGCNIVRDHFVAILCLTTWCNTVRGHLGAILCMTTWVQYCSWPLGCNTVSDHFGAILCVASLVQYCAWPLGCNIVRDHRGAILCAATGVQYCARPPECNIVRGHSLGAILCVATTMPYIAHRVTKVAPHGWRANNTRRCYSHDRCQRTDPSRPYGILSSAAIVNITQYTTALMFRRSRIPSIRPSYFPIRPSILSHLPLLATSCPPLNSARWRT